MVNAILPNVNMGRVLASPGVTGNAVVRALNGEIPSNIGPRKFTFQPLTLFNALIFENLGVS